VKPQTIKLRDHKYQVVPQPIGYLMNELGSDVQAVLTADDGVGGARIAGAKAHGLLKIFIPDLMPLHEFLGFASKEALEAEDYDRNLDRSPEAPQLTEAFKAAKKVNGGEVLDVLKATAERFIETGLIQKATTWLVAAGAELAKENGGISVETIKEALEQTRPSTSATSEPSPTSPSTNGGSVSPTSTSPTTPPPVSAD
jgi:hypothetical protein